MRRAFKFLFGALAILLVGAVAFVAWYVFTDNAPAKPRLSVSQPAGSGGPATPAGSWHVVRGPSVFVGYRIKELFGDAVLKRDAVGRTPAVNGTMTIAGDRVTAVAVRADVTQLDSGRAARDAYTRDNALETGKFANARFTLTAPITLPASVAKGREVHTVGDRDAAAARRDPPREGHARRPLERAHDRRGRHRADHARRLRHRRTRHADRQGRRSRLARARPEVRAGRYRRLTTAAGSRAIRASKTDTMRAIERSPATDGSTAFGSRKYTPMRARPRRR